MVEKTVKTKTSNDPEKAAKEVTKTKIKRTVKPVISESPQTAEKSAKDVKSEKTETVVKEQKPKKKRISKGLATHNRRVKQEKRRPSSIHS